MMSTDREFLQDQLAAEHSRAQTLRIAGWIGHDHARLAALMDIFLGDNYRLTQRAAWTLHYIGRHNTGLMAPWLPQLVDSLARRPIHDAVKRNVLRLFEDLDIPDAVLGELADHCFGYLANPQEAVAIRCFSMTVLEKICRAVPELKPELRLLIEENLETGSAAIRSRGKKILERIKS